MAKEKPITINTIYALTGKIVKTEILMRVIFQGAVSINGVMHDVKSLSDCGVGYLVEIIDDIPEPHEFQEGGSLYPCPTFQEMDPETAAKLSWFIQEKKEIKETFGLKRIIIDASNNQILAIPLDTRETRKLS